MSIITKTSIADGIPFDPNLPGQIPTNGYLLTWNSTSQQWEARAAGSITNGVVPPFVFGKDGNCTVGTYFRTHVVPGGPGGSGQIIKGSNTLIEMGLTNVNAVASNTVVQLIRRTAINTWSDIAGASVTLIAGNYTQTNTGLSVVIGPDWEISAYNKSGSSLNNVLLTIYLVPQ